MKYSCELRTVSIVLLAGNGTQSANDKNKLSAGFEFGRKFLSKTSPCTRPMIAYNYSGPMSRADEKGDERCWSKSTDRTVYNGVKKGEKENVENYIPPQ